MALVTVHCCTQTAMHQNRTMAPKLLTHAALPSDAAEPLTYSSTCLAALQLE